MQKPSVLVLASIGIALLVLEMIVRAYYASTGHPPPHPDPSIRAEWEWARAHLAAGRATLPGSAAFDPNLGWLPDRDVGHWLEQKAVGMTQPGPFRESRDASADRVPRLIILGDSFTFGIYVDNAQSYPAVLQREHLPQWEVLNFGVPGFGPDQMLLLYQQIGVRYSADVVVFALYTGGEERATRRFAYYAKPYFLLADRRLVLQGVPVVPPELLYGDYQDGERAVAPFPYSYLYGAVAASLAHLTEEPIVDSSNPDWQLIASILGQFRNDAVGHGAQPFLLVIPTDQEVEHGAGDASGGLAIAEAKQLGMGAIALRNPFATEAAAHPEDPLFRPASDGGHFSQHGHAFAAELLAKGLLSETTAVTQSASNKPAARGSAGPSARARREAEHVQHVE